MNCRQAENMIPDLARGQLLDAAARESLLAHADSCAPCDARLADERTLTDGLRAFAHEDAARELRAPQHVENALLAAFRQHTADNNNAGASSRQHLATVTTATAQAGVRDTESERREARVLDLNEARGARRWTRRSFAVAASIAAAVVFAFLALAAARVWRIAPESTQPEQRAEVENQESTPAGKDGLQKREEATASAPQIVDEDSAIKNDAGRKERPSPQPHVARVNRRKGSERHAPAVKSAAQAQNDTAVAANGGETEIMTDFFALPQSNTLAQSDGGGHLMRVELPRSALATLGLPVNPERADERVKADVLIGDDGLARAIRFVR